MLRWVDAIELSMKTYKEQEKSVNKGLTVNVDKIVHIYDKDGVDKFKEKMEMDFKKVQAEYELADSEMVGDWLRQAEELSKKLIGVSSIVNISELIFLDIGRFTCLRAS